MQKYIVVIEVVAYDPDQFDDVERRLSHISALATSCACGATKVWTQVGVKRDHEDRPKGFLPPNLDALSPQELRNMCTLFTEMTDYATHKVRALEHRAAGRFELAAQEESICESIYNALPMWASW